MGYGPIKGKEYQNTTQSLMDRNGAGNLKSGTWDVNGNGGAENRRRFPSRRAETNP